MAEQYPFRKHFESMFAALNVIQRNKAVAIATNTVSPDTPAVANGCKVAR